MKTLERLSVTIALAVSLSGDAIVGTAASDGVAMSGFQTPPPESASKTEGATHEVVGTLSSAKGSRLTITTRTGRVVEVDATAAIQGHRSCLLIVGHPVCARGEFDRKGVLHADVILRAKDSSVNPPAKQ